VAVIVGPAEELAEAATFAPQEREKTPRRGGLGLRTEERLHAPTQVGTFPGPQAVASGYTPVVAQHTKHVEETVRFAALVSRGHALPQTRNMRDVMRAVPGIRRQHIVQGHGAALGMQNPPSKILGAHATQQRHPALVQ